MSKDDRQEKGVGLFSSFRDYALANPKEAKAVENLYAYRTLGALNHDLFFDGELYSQLKGALDTKDFFNHKGFQLYEEQVEQNKPKYRAQSDAELPANVKKELATLEEQFLQWRNRNMLRYAQNKDIFETIVGGAIDGLDKDKLVRSLKEFPQILPGLLLVYQIRMHKDKLPVSEPEA